MHGVLGTKPAAGTAALPVKSPSSVIGTLVKRPAIEIGPAEAFLFEAAYVPGVGKALQFLADIRKEHANHR